MFNLRYLQWGRAIACVLLAGFTLSGCAWPGVQGQAREMQGNFPTLLLHDATRRSCIPIADFFHRDGISLPPFFFDEQAENREYAWAYVCQRQADYFLIFSALENTSKCQKRELSLGTIMPGGLRALDDRPALAIFRAADHAQSNRKISNKNMITDFRPMAIEYDGVQQVFYCDQGEWVSAVFD